MGTEQEKSTFTKSLNEYPDPKDRHYTVTPVPGTEQTEISFTIPNGGGFLILAEDLAREGVQVMGRTRGKDLFHIINSFVSSMRDDPIAYSMLATAMLIQGPPSVRRGGTH